FHSRMMEPALAPFAEVLRGMRLARPRIPFLSNLTGTWIDPATAADAEYWLEHLRRPVRFGDALAELFREPGRLLLEVGPGRALGTLARRHPACPAETVIVASQGAVTSDTDPLEALIAAAGRLWVSGVELDAEGLVRGERRRRVPLPTYPFEGRVFWPRLTGAPAETRESQLDEWFHLPAWHRALHPVPGPSTAPLGERGPWLLLGDGDGLADAFERVLAESGAMVLRLECGKSVGVRGAVDLERRLAEVDAPARVIDLRSLDGGSGEGLGELEGLLALGRALAKAEPLEVGRRLLLVARGLHAVLPGEVAYPSRAALLGPLRVLPQEVPGLVCRHADIGDDPRDDALARRLLEEIEAAAAEPGVAYRNGRRWVQDYRRVELPAAAPRLGPLSVRASDAADGTGFFLLTGGWGRVGLRVASYLATKLAEHGGARLAMVGRSAMDEGRRRERRRLEALGAEVLPLEADVADANSLEAAIGAAERRWGRLAGVFHLATPGRGSRDPRNKPVARLEGDELARLLEPKVGGLQAL
ncbi:MAG: KR domain-containing protein, partial [Acidobacteria bacterium]|nr:KR domain-containing protein [Acidobacteriota bacterium]